MVPRKLPPPCASSNKVPNGSLSSHIQAYRWDEQFGRNQTNCLFENELLTSSGCVGRLPTINDSNGAMKCNGYTGLPPAVSARLDFSANTGGDQLPELGLGTAEGGGSCTLLHCPLRQLLPGEDTVRAIEDSLRQYLEGIKEVRGIFFVRTAMLTSNKFLFLCIGAAFLFFTSHRILAPSCKRSIPFVKFFF